MKLVFTLIAKEELSNIKDYIKARNPIAYEKLWLRLNEVFKLLQDNPYIGGLGRVEDTKEFFIINTNYYVVYRLNKTNNRLEILNILHTKSKY